MSILQSALSKTKQGLALSLAAMSLATAAHAPAQAAPIANGTQTISIPLASGAIRAFTFRPNCKDPGLLIVMHGKNRTAENYMKYARDLATARCLLVVAPEFDKERFPSWRYQHGGVSHHGQVQPKSQWTGNLLLEIIDRVRADEGRPDMPYSLIGHSAGGQILSRFAALHPSRAQRIVVANPSSYMWPDLKTQAPYGFKGIPHASAALRRYLEAPVTIYVGREDKGSKDLDVREQAMKQGQNRYERGLRVFAAARRTAQEHGWKFNWRLVERDGAAHEGRKMLAPEAWEALAP